MTNIPAPESQLFPADLKRAHVIIADDEAANRIMLRAVCEKIGVGIISEAADGVEALEIVTRLRPDLILLDINMPRMDGLELMRRLRADSAYDGISILVQTSLQDIDDRVQCFKLGATDVISRPLHLAELEARIRAHLRSALSSRILFDFRNRIQAHIEITRAFLDAILPDPRLAEELAADYRFACTSVYKPHDEIGGDLWSLRAFDADHLAVVLVDASAHGLAGAINALRVDCLIQQHHDHLHDPGTFINLLDAAMAKISFGQLFAGIFAMTIHHRTGIIRYAGSGIPSPLLLHEGAITTLKTPGMPVGSGMLAAKTATATMASGDLLTLFTDGWLEALPTDPATALLQAEPQNANPTGWPIQDDGLLDDLTLITLRRK